MRPDFRLTFHAHAAFEAELIVVRDSEFEQVRADAGMTHVDIPAGCAAIIDAERELVAIVPDVVGLVNPVRRLPELVCEILNEAARPGFGPLTDLDLSLQILETKIDSTHVGDLSASASGVFGDRDDLKDEE